jgi:hypothetical protein
MLFSSIVARRQPKARLHARNNVTDNTAIGTDADTVKPTFSTKYSDEAPKIIPSTTPTNTAGSVNSGSDRPEGIKGIALSVVGDAADAAEADASDDTELLDAVGSIITTSRYATSQTIPPIIVGPLRLRCEGALPA